MKKTSAPRKKATKDVEPSTSQDPTLSDVDTCSWDVCNITASKIDWPEWAVRNTVQLLEEDNTIPFIARYRREQTNGMEADKLRELKETVDELNAVQSKIKTVVNAIVKQGKMTKTLRRSLFASQTTTEVEHLYAPFKAGSKRTLAERAKELGLEPVTNLLLTKPRSVQLETLVDPKKKGISNLKEVSTGVQHILADMIAKDKDTMDYVRNLCKKAYVCIESTKSKSSAKQDEKESKVDTRKFEIYFNFQKPVKYMQPHQTLAINRGENQKVLTVKVNIPDTVKEDFLKYCRYKWIPRDTPSILRQLWEDSITDAYTRLIHPLMVRHFRSELTKTAEKASVDVFATNLKRVLLMPPLRGRVVMGMDPGFKHGCKFAITSATGQVLETGVAYLHNHSSNNKLETKKIKDALVKHRCETIAVGNGTGCRETEKWLSECIKHGTFKPLKVVYCITSEAGASIYSASDAAIAELPNIDIAGRGAVSIARRLQDPLVELVKIEPKHIGVGMYQHDIPDSQLKSSLDGVVEDCVSFVGVDINVCSETLLRRIAGMTNAKVKSVLKWREENGPFVCREQLKSVKGLGPKTFVQCVGFVRVMPETSNGIKSEAASNDADEETTKVGRKRKAPAKASKAKKAKLEFGPNPLDMTSIHPESYEVAERLMREAGVAQNMIGQRSGIETIERYLKGKDIGRLADTYQVGEPTMKLILDGLQQPIGYDMREKFEKPLFKEGVKSMEDMNPGEVLTGQVTNVTHFGAFVDVGVNRDGLIHKSKMNPRNMDGKESLQVGDKVECVLLQVDAQRGRINLQLSKLL